MTTVVTSTGSHQDNALTKEPPLSGSKQSSHRRPDTAKPQRNGARAYERFCEPPQKPAAGTRTQAKASPLEAPQSRTTTPRRATLLSAQSPPLSLRRSDRDTAGRRPAQHAGAPPPAPRAAEGKTLARGPTRSLSPCLPVHPHDCLFLLLTSPPAPLGAASRRCTRHGVAVCLNTRAGLDSSHKKTRVCKAPNQLSLRKPFFRNHKKDFTCLLRPRHHATLSVSTTIGPNNTRDRYRDARLFKKTSTKKGVSARCAPARRPQCARLRPGAAAHRVHQRRGGDKRSGGGGAVSFSHFEPCTAQHEVVRYHTLNDGLSYQSTKPTNCREKTPPMFCSAHSNLQLAPAATHTHTQAYARARGAGLWRIDAGARGQGA
ncbi:hypothetical protein PLESTM_001223800 [Pleodorina starrii]|nr:hypothetical protein PLESTM_001223800 [Pleodorina starrii]